MTSLVMARSSILILALGLLLTSAALAGDMNAATTDVYPVMHRGGATIQIDADLGDWAGFTDVLVMGQDSWEALGGSWDNADDLTGRLNIVYDETNLYFGFEVTDSEYVAEGSNPWENDGAQMAIDASAGTIAAGWPNATTHLYNFSVKDGWLPETGPFAGDAEIEMYRDDAAKQTVFEWRMPVDIFAGPGTGLMPGQEIAFAIIVNDSDMNAKGQTGWIGWGSHTIVYGKNPEEMKTLAIQKATAVEPQSKLSVTWASIKG